MFSNFLCQSKYSEYLNFTKLYLVKIRFIQSMTIPNNNKEIEFENQFENLGIIPLKNKV